jgi:hypothetical protein
MSDRHDKKRATMAANLEAQTGRTLAEHRRDTAG